MRGSLALGLVAGVLLAIAQPAVGADEAATTMARLRIELTTASDWSRVELEGVSFPVVRVLGHDGGVTVSQSGDRWTVLNRTGGPTTVVVDAIAAAIEGRPTVEVSLDQGWLGWSALEVVDEARGTAPLVALATGGGEPFSADRRIDTSELLGPEQLRLPHADERPLALAFYYPWFGRTGYDSSRMADVPAEPRSAWIAEDVRSHVRQARGAGIDGFVTSWAGAAANGVALDHVLRAHEAEGGVTTVYLETPRATSGILRRIDPAKLALWLDEALPRALSPAFLRAADGVPVVFVYMMSSVDDDTWKAIATDSARRGRPVHLVGDADPSSHAPVLFGWHRYFATESLDDLAARWERMVQRNRGPNLLDPEAPLRLSMATVSPGYDDSRLWERDNPIVYRGPNGERYDGTWDAAVAADPDWILITSWNEWYEGTSVEPGKGNGDLALRQTAARVAAWKAAETDR